jgi:ATP-binding cassette, subfamily B, multidrug efflux pump
MSSSDSVADPSHYQRTQENDWRLLMRLVPYARQNIPILALSLSLLVPLAIAGATQPVVIGQVISLIRQEPTTFAFLRDRPLLEGINILAVFLLCTVIIQLTLQGLQSYLVQKVGQSVTASIRNDLFEHVTSLAIRFFDRTPVGKLITRLTSDVEALGDVFATGAIGIVGDLFAMLVYAITMFWLQWQLATLLIFLIVPITWLITHFQHRYRQANYRAREELSSLNSMLQENLVGANIVQLFRRQHYNSELFRSVNQRYITEIDRTIFYDSAVSATLEWVGLVAIALVIGFGGQQILNQQLTFGILSSFIVFAQRLFDPLRQFAEKFTAIQSGLTAIERISDVLNEPIEIQDPNTLNNQRGIEVSQYPGEIRFENVWFAYKPNEYVLKNLSFIVHPGEKIAIVGPTGAGKSSIIRLLCRLYDPTQGRILLDSIDIRELPQQELRRRMGVILQESFLFVGDVKSNIALGEQYSLEEIQQAAIQTNIANFIKTLPNGYKTRLRERGTNLSGGQKQLIAFARTAIRNPQILVLDEATSNLDVGTERDIQDSLGKMMLGRTVIIIAHRLSSIRTADRILVLRKGELVETGTHEELLYIKGMYSRLYALQMLGHQE